MKGKIVFFGSGWYTVPVIEKLIPYGLDLVVTTEKDPNSRFLKFCTENNIQTLSVSNSKDLNSQFSTLNSQFNLAVLASFGAIIPDEIINDFEHGIMNIHPSLLPKYKGPSPIQFQLLNGEIIVGVTVIELDDQVDHGPILAQKPFNLKGYETSEDLLSILFEQGAEMVEDLVIKLENGEKLIKTPQDHSQESWTKKITKADGMINLSQFSTLNSQLSNKIRAYYPWPGVWFKANLKGQEKIVKLLPENKIQVEGKNAMSFKDFINGFGEEGKTLLEQLGLM